MTMSRDPRALLEDAQVLFPGDARRRLLREALERADAAADAQAAGIALAMLAQEDTAVLPDAERALRRAEAAGVETSWILLYLAEASYAAGDAGAALRHAEAVRPGYFVDRDLRWRAVRMDELRAAALLVLGRYDEGVSLAGAVCATLAADGERDDCSPPAQLAQAALRCVAEGTSPADRAAGCAVIRSLATSLDVGEWFSSGLSGRLRDALRACDG
jgi:hypothetical protein